MLVAPHTTATTALKATDVKDGLVDGWAKCVMITKCNGVHGIVLSPFTYSLRDKLRAGERISPAFEQNEVKEDERPLGARQIQNIKKKEYWGLETGLDARGDAVIGNR